MSEKRKRKVYRATLVRASCQACNENVLRGMPVVYADDGRPIHAICERIYDLGKGAR